MSTEKMELEDVTERTPLMMPRTLTFNGDESIRQAEFQI